MGDVRDPERDQVAPTPNDKQPIQDMVVEDIVERKEHGIRKYGTPVQADNGRSMLQDAYEETLDLAVYLRGAIEEGTDFAVQSEARGRYRIVDAEGRVVKETSGYLNGRSVYDAYENLRPGDTIQEQYATYTHRYEWSELSPESKERIADFEKDRDRIAARRKSDKKS
jgi:hypothetical protein